MDIQNLKHLITVKARSGEAVKFFADQNLVASMCYDFQFDTIARGNDYHFMVKKFHREKYGRELVAGGEFGNPGDLQDPMIALEYYFFLVSRERMRTVERDGPMIVVHALV